MKTFGLIFKNMGFLFVSDLITRLLSFVLFIAIARVLGQEGLGNYSFIFAFTGIFFVLNDFGISTLFLREGSRNPERIQHYFKNAATMKLFFGLLAIIVVAIAINFAQVTGELRTAVYFAAFALFFSNLKELFLAVFQVRQQMFFVGVSRVVEIFLIVLLGIYAVNSGHGLIGLTLAFIASYFIVFLINAFACARLIKLSLGFDFGFQEKFLRTALPFWFTGLFMTITFRTDAIMIQLIRGAAETGLYSSSFRIMEALYFIPLAVISAVFPAMSRLHKTDKVMLTRLYRKMFYYLLALALPMGIGTMILADRIILFLYGEEFAGAGFVLQLLILAEVAMFLYGIMGYLLNAINRQILFTLTAAGAAILNVAMNLVLIPKFSYVGAAVSTVVTSFLIFVALFYFAGKNGYSLNVLKISIKPLIAAVVMTLVLLALRDLHVLLIVSASAITYFAILLLIKGVEEEELILVRKYIKRFI